MGLNFRLAVEWYDAKKMIAFVRLSEEEYKKSSAISHTPTHCMAAYNGIIECMHLHVCAYYPTFSGEVDLLMYSYMYTHIISPVVQVHVSVRNWKTGYFIHSFSSCQC